ncbi:MAG TPA: hypothetical protein VF017_16950 [Thermoanaerobaculia bacterium]|nr:hypothetical protein [Thermoanaerobaculia bacterium]
MRIRAIHSARCSLLLAGWLVTGWAATPLAACPLELEWERFLKTPGYDTRLAGLAAWGQEELVVGAWLRPVDGELERFAVGVFRVTSAGESRRLVTLERLDPTRATPFEQVLLTALDDLAVVGEKRLFLAAEGNMHSAAVLELSESGQLQKGQLLPLDANAMLLRLLPLSTGQLLALGRQGQSALALILTEGGEIQRRFVDPLGPTARYLDGLEEPGGGLLLVANAGSYDLMQRGPSKVHLRRLAADGSVSKEHVFKGRYGSVAALPGGRIALVYDRADSSAQEVVLQVYDEALKLVWEQPVTASQQGTSRFRVAPLADGTLVVAGSKEGKPHVSVFAADGARQWESWRSEDPNLGQDHSVVVRGRAVYIGTSNYVEAPGGEILQEIRLTKYHCSDGR